MVPSIHPTDTPGDDDMKISFQQLSKIFSPTFNDTKTNLYI